MAFRHSELSRGRWYTLSVIEQMANIGSEVGRALRWQGENSTLFQGAVGRALELFDLTLGDPRWRETRGRLKEIARARELFCDAVFGEDKYKTSLEDLERYFFQFAVASRLGR